MFFYAWSCFKFHPLCIPTRPPPSSHWVSLPQMWSRSSWRNSSLFVHSKEKHPPSSDINLRLHPPSGSSKRVERYKRKSWQNLINIVHVYSSGDMIWNWGCGVFSFIGPSSKSCKWLNVSAHMHLYDQLYLYPCPPQAQKRQFPLQLPLKNIGCCQWYCHSCKEPAIQCSS